MDNAHHGEGKIILKCKSKVNRNFRYLSTQFWALQLFFERAYQNVEGIKKVTILEQIGSQ